MSWQAKYIVIRRKEDGSALTIAHNCDSIKDANYWMNYIAVQGDALFMTPAHPKHPGGNSLVYQSHKLTPGKVERNEQGWKSEVGSLSLPEMQA